MILKFSIKKIYLIASVFFLLMATTSIIDMIYDSSEDFSHAHLYFELFTFLFSLLGASFFVISMIRSQQENKELSLAFHKVHRENSEFKKKIGHFAKGLSEAIDIEFNKWGLTPMEKQVGMLILKGLATKKISEVLEISDKTVRHHCSAIYKKSGLGGRTELSAYFLEDLLVVAPIHTKD